MISSQVEFGCPGRPLQDEMLKEVAISSDHLRPFSVCWGCFRVRPDLLLFTLLGGEGWGGQIAFTFSCTFVPDATLGTAHFGCLHLLVYLMQRCLWGGMASQASGSFAWLSWFASGCYVRHAGNILRFLLSCCWHMLPRLRIYWKHKFQPKNIKQNIR